MSFAADIDDEIFRPVTRLSKGFALRDLIAGAEFEIRDDSCQQDVDEEEFVKSSTFSPDEVEDYYNENALDLEADENENIISFPALREKMSNLTSDGKIMKLVLRSGTGNIVKPDSVVYIHYSAHANLEAAPFDNSYLRRNRPERYQLGTGSMIPGLEIGISSMRKGEKSQFLIDPLYAFGDKGCPPRIAPDATVLFEVELVNFTDCVTRDDPENLEVEDRHSFPHVSRIARTYHTMGNDCFKQNNEKAAILKYKKAVDLLLDCHLTGEEEETEQKKLLLRLYCNLSVCYLKIKRPERVCIVAREAMYIDEENARKNAKLLYNWGSALVTLGEYRKAADMLRSALKLQPNNRTIIEEISKLDKKKAQYAQQERISFQRALGYQVKKEEVPVESNSEDVNVELLNEVKKRIEEAKTGKSVKLNLLPEVINRVEELCRSLTIDDDSLLVERVGKAITISKVKDEK